jgi:negative regulator of replication initiation
MTREDADKVTQLFNAVVREAGRVSLQAAAALHTTTRTVKNYVDQMRQILVLAALVEQNRTIARLLNNLEQVIPDGS